MRSWDWGLALVAIAGVLGCGDDSADPPMDLAPMHVPSTCASEREAPIRDGAGGFTCRPVGASSAGGPEWPDVAGLPAPIAYVRSGATGGDGTMGMPFATLAEALADTPAPGSIVLAGGNHPIDTALTVTGTVTIAGTGALDGSTLVPSADLPGIRVEGAGAALTLRDVAIEYRDPVTVAGGTSSGVSIGMGASATLEDVIVRDALHGVRVEGGNLTATRLTVLRAVAVGLWITSNGRANVDDFSVRFGARYGVLSDESLIELRHGLVADHERDGIALLGGTAGEVNMIENVTSLGNGVTAMRVERGAYASLVLCALEGTRVPDGTVGGDGLFVGDASAVSIDPGITSDADQGHGSSLVGNARTGVLGSGMDTTLDINGVLLGSNAGPGAFFQRDAEVMRLGYARIEDNAALGIGAASGGHIFEIPCSYIGGTRMGELETVSETLDLGDGLSLAEGTGMTNVHGNQFNDNARFAAVFSGSDATMRDNTGSGNRYGMGIYGTSAVDSDASNVIGASEDSPGLEGLQTARGEINLTEIPP